MTPAEASDAKPEGQVQPPTSNSPKKRPQKRLIWGGVAMLGLGGLISAWWLFFPLIAGGQHELYIYPNDSPAAVHQRLEKVPMHSRFRLKLLLSLSGYDTRVRAGRYVLEPGMSPYKVFRALYGGRQTPLTLVVQPYRGWEKLFGRVAAPFPFSPKDVEASWLAPQRLAALGVDSANLLARILPNSYQVYWTVSPEQLLERLLRSYERFWDAERRAKADELGLTPQEVMVLASIVQEETYRTDEMPRIAGVYLNRLRKGMRLQADPTVRFAVGDFSLQRVRRRHLRLESPYNTYRNKGLPPGPITNPAPQTVEAVLNAEQHAYLFFAAKPDGSGYHRFSKSFKEHVAAANAYRDSLDRWGVE